MNDMQQEEQELLLPKHENPFFKKENKVNVTRILAISSFALLTVLLLFVIFSLIFYRNSENYVKLSVFTGNKRISSETLTQAINESLSGNYLLLIPKKNIYALRTSKLEKSLIDKFGLTKIHIDKIYSQRMIHVQLEESPIQFTATIGESTYFLASDGTILEDITSQLDSYKDLFNVIVPSESILQPDEENSHARIRNELISVLEQIQDLNLQLDTSYVVALKSSTQSINDIQLITSTSWYIYIDTSRDLQKQIDDARDVFIDKIKGTDKESTLEYIDVRVPGKAYFK